MARVLGRMTVISVVPVGLMFVSMHLMDSLNMFSLFPGVIWVGIPLTAIYIKSREVVTPLWMSRQQYLFAIFAILTQSLLNYKLLQISWSQTETRKTMANIQSELNLQKTGLTQEEKKFMENHKRLMSELKDPFL
jgi:hypothetical protein